MVEYKYEYNTLDTSHCVIECLIRCTAHVIPTDPAPAPERQQQSPSFSHFLIADCVRRAARAQTAADLAGDTAKKPAIQHLIAVKRLQRKRR